MCGMMTTVSIRPAVYLHYTERQRGRTAGKLVEIEGTFTRLQNREPGATKYKEYVMHPEHVTIPVTKPLLPFHLLFRDAMSCPFAALTEKKSKKLISAES